MKSPYIVTLDAKKRVSQSIKNEPPSPPSQKIHKKQKSESFLIEMEELEPLDHFCSREFCSDETSSNLASLHEMKQSKSNEINKHLGNLKTYESHIESVKFGLEQMDLKMATIQKLSTSLQYLEKLERYWSQINEIEQIDDIEKAIEQLQEINLECLRKHSHAFAFISTKIQSIKEKIKSKLLEQILNLLTTLNYPNTQFKLDKENVDDANALFFHLNLLCALEDYDYHFIIKETFLHSLKVNFAFHFDNADRPTSRIDKPEWYLDYLFEQVMKHSEFIRECLDIESNMPFIDSVIAEILSPQVIARMDDISKDPHLLIHTFESINRFLTHLINEFDVSEDGIEKLSLSFFGVDDHANSWIDAQLGILVGGSEEYVYDAKKWGKHKSDEKIKISDVLCVLEEYFSNRLFSSLVPISIKVSFIERVILGDILDPYFEQCEYKIPPFHDTRLDIEIIASVCVDLASLCKHMTRLEWGESVDAIEISSSREFIDVFGADFSSREATILYASHSKFSGLLRGCIEKLSLHLFESFSRSANVWSSSMHYALNTDDQIRINPQFRQALLDFEDTYQFTIELIKDDQVLERIHEIFLSLFSKWIMMHMQRNLFRKEAISAWKSDLNRIKGIFSKCFSVKNNFDAVEEATMILECSRDDYDRYIQLIESEDIESISDSMNEMRITELSILQFESILQSIRWE